MDRHSASGDVVLSRLVKTCPEELREEDVVGRLGGEECATLLPEAAEHTAMQVAERVCLAVADIEIAHADAPPIRFTTSISVSSLRKGTSNSNCCSPERIMHSMQRNRPAATASGKAWA